MKRSNQGTNAEFKRMVIRMLKDLRGVEINDLNKNINKERVNI